MPVYQLVQNTVNLQTEWKYVYFKIIKLCYPLFLGLKMTIATNVAELAEVYSFLWLEPEPNGLWLLYFLTKNSCC